MKSYKRSFILSNLMLVGFVLLAMNTAVFVYFHHNAVSELKTTMMQKTEPYDTIRNILSEGTPPENPAPPSSNSQPPRRETPPPNGGDGRKYAKSVYVFFYNAESGKVTVVSKDELKDNDTLTETAQKIYSQSDDFGVLPGENLYYYRKITGNDTKVAIASRNFIRLQMLELFFVLFAIFAVSMLCVYLISRKMARRAAKPLEDAIAREKQFITDASHDLKTPLTVILSNADIMSKSAEGENAKWLGATKQAAESMKLLIEQMLTLAESETKTDFSTEIVDFSDIAEKNALVMDGVAFEKNIEYKTEIDGNIKINANADCLNRITASLIDNAIKYEPTGGKICVRLYTKGKNAVFSVQNKNAVIAKDDLPHIFERFYRSDKSRHAASSHGLGLAIVKNLTERIGGKADVTSDTENGTVFTLTFVLN